MSSPSSLRRPLRIAMVVISQYESDPRVRRQAEALAARGDEVTVLALRTEGRPEHELLHGVRVVHLPVDKYRGESARAYLGLYGGFAAKAAAWLARRPRRFDLVQIHSMPEGLVLAALAQKVARVPVLLDVHDITSHLFEAKFAGVGGAPPDRRGAAVVAAVHASDRLAMAFADHVLTVHEPYTDLLRSRTRTPVSTVMNSPDERLFTPRRWRPWDPHGEVVFSYHGLIAPRHGLVEAVTALGAVRADLPGARMKVRGSGDGLPALRARVAELGLAGVVDLPERLYPITDIPAEIDTVNIGVVPSKLDRWTAEVLPTKLLEYSVMGIPCITFRNPVISRYFPDDAVTYVDEATPESLAAAMRSLAGDPDRARAQVERASQVVAGISWARQRQVYLDLVDDLAGRGDPGR